MELKGYREQLSDLKELFPNRVSITPEEAATAIGCDKRTIYSTMYRAKDPLPYVVMSKRQIMIPIAQFAYWLCKCAR